MHDHVIGIGDNDPPAAAAVPGRAGREALIRRRGRPVEISGRVLAGTWEPAIARETAPEIEPRMGWTGGIDTPAAEVRLTFPTRAQAAAHAERQDLDDRVEPACGVRARTLRVWQSNRRAAPARLQAGEPSRGRRAGDPAPASLPDLERALVNPAAVFETPASVLDHPRLLPSCKREILRRWAWDEYLKEVAAAEGMAEGESSQLDVVKAALLALGAAWRPHPAAPAAAVPIVREAELLSAA